MKFGVLWKTKGLRPREPAPETARESDSSVGDWLNTVVDANTDDAVGERPGQPSPAQTDAAPRSNAVAEAPERDAYDPGREATRRDATRTRAGLGDIHGRLDKLAAKLESLARIDNARRRAPPDSARARLLKAAQSQRRAAREPDISVDAAVAEIAAWQRMLDSESEHEDFAAAAAAPDSPRGGAGQDPSVIAGPPTPASQSELPPRSPAASAPPPGDRALAATRGASADRVAGIETLTAAPPTVPSVDVGGLELQLRGIASRIDALQQTRDFETASGAIRSDLAEISRQLNEALPRRAVESLEIEVRALGERIAHSRQCGLDPNTLAGLERGLTEVREALRVLTPAEKLVGFGEAVKALSEKLEVILAKYDRSALQQLEVAVGDLRNVVSHIASHDALTRVAEDVRALAARVDGIANTVASGHAVSALERRIDTLAAALTASSEAGRAVPHDLEKLLSGLIEKLEWVQLTHTDHAALAHLEDRIAMLVQRFDASDTRLSHLEAIERGLADLLVHMEEIRRGNSGPAAMPPPRAALDREAAESEQGGRPTEETLEAAQNAVEHLVGRLATTQTGMRAAVAPRALPEAAAGPAPTRVQQTEGGDPVVAALAASAGMQVATSRVAAARAPIDPTLPPDHPLEPGSLPATSAAERIAASEAASSSAKPPVISDSERPNFIAAARRAAQAAAWDSPSPKAKDGDAAAASAQPSTLSPRLRQLIIVGGAVLILIGCAGVAIRLLDKRGSHGSPQVHSERVLPQAGAAKDVPSSEPAPGAPLSLLPSPATAPPSSEPTPSAPAPASSSPATATPSSPPPAIDTGKPGRQSMVHGVTDESATAALTAPTAGASAPASLPSWISPDITSALPRPPPVTSITSAADQAEVAAGDQLPAAIGDSALRNAALAGDAAAAYVVAMRFADGRGVSRNEQAAAHWLARAAKAGLAPAQFRLGGFYEKGLGVKKDLAAARDLYLSAAEKGNANAMHNLAVLYAEGAAGTPDYGKAVDWFRKAADRGVKDSQYNLGILYARGIGVGQDEAESYKWFALAAAQGDKEAVKKRDEMASRLDPQTLAAIRLALKNWSPKPQPEDAVGVQTMAAWDAPIKDPPVQRQN